MNRLTAAVGRLVIIDTITPVAAAEVEKLSNDVQAAIERIGKEVVIYVNLTRADLLPPHIAASYISLMRRDNPSLLRSAFWVSDTGTFGKHMGRMLDQANNTRRRQFLQRKDLEAWLGEVLNPDEKKALQAHLNMYGSADPSAQRSQ